MFGWFRRRREARVREALIKQQAQDRRDAFVSRINSDIQVSNPHPLSIKRNDYYEPISLMVPTSAPNQGDINQARRIINQSIGDDYRREQVDNSFNNTLLTAMVVESIIDSTPTQAYEPSVSYDPTPSYDPGPSTDYSSSFDSGSSGGAGGGSDW